jgi:hypothetical protein
VWEEEIMTFSYYTCVLLEMSTKTNILTRIAGLWAQICFRDLGNTKQRKVNGARCFTHDQYAGQSNNNEHIKSKTFEISAQI